MRLYKLFFILFLCFVPFFSANSRVKLSTPYDLEIDQLNQEEKDKLKNINYSQTVGMPKQYKGKLKYTEGKEDIRLKDVRAYFGIGGRFTVAKDTKIKYSATNDETNINFTTNFNYFASAGLYWRNGIRTEFEYSEAAIKANTDATVAIKKKDGTYTSVDDAYIHFLVRTYMVNLILENTNVKSPIKPYIGFGVGVVSGNMRDFLNTASSNVFGGQVMAGLSYPISDGIAAIYLGYRGVMAAEMEQTFVRTNGTTDVDSKGTYNYQSHNVDLGVKFFF
ncbi:MAG: hypothetical protein PHY80_01880 [Rickettsiales bacterium]|nr:hypothetical protein [Rickettsiales bacterium]